MRRFTLMLAIGAFPIAAHGCVGASTESPDSRPIPAAYSFASTGLTGTWRGYFMTTASIGDSRMIHGDYAFQIRDDGTYSGTRILRLVSGSSRGGQGKISGRVTVKGNRVMLDDDAGWRMTLQRRGDTLYGVNADPGTQWPIAITMEKISPPAEASR